MRFNRVTQSTLDQTRAINEDAKRKVDSFAASTSDDIKVLSSPITESAMKNMVKQGFLKLDVKKLGETRIEQDHLSKMQYKITGEIAPNNLFLILDIVPRLHQKHVSATFDLPLSLKKNTKGNIDFSLGVSITKSTYHAE